MKRHLTPSAAIAQKKLPKKMMAGVLAVSLAPGLALADDTKSNDTAQLETVKVQAQQAPRGSYNAATTTLGKQKQALKDVPQAVSVVTRQLIADQGDINMKDVLKNVSGITFVAGEGGRSGDSIILRGFSAFGDTYRDGQRDVAQYNRDPFNDERIEVLKGASSMLFGRGSTGGVINQVSKTPFAGEQVELSTTVGTNDFYRGTADINQALSDTAAIRLNVMATNDGSPDGISESKRHGIAPSIAFGLGEPTTIVLSHMQLKENNTPMLGVPFDPNTLQPIDVPVDRYYGLQGMNSEDITADISTVRATHKLDSKNEIAAQLRVGRYDREVIVSQPQLRNSPAGTPVTDATQLGYSGKLRGSLNETQSLSIDYNGKFDTGSLGHELLAGVELTRETQNAYSIRATTAIPNVVGSVGNPEGFYTGGYTRHRSNDFVTRNLAAYVTDTVALNPQWKVMAGLRMDQLEGTYKTYNTTTGAQTGESKRDDRGLSYRTGLIWQPTQASSYYLGYSSLMNPSGEAYQYDLSAGLSTDRQKPERNKHYEVGAKWDLADGDATLRAALFRTEKLNERNTDALSPDVAILYAKRHTDGIEVEVAGRLSEKWEVFAGATLMDPKIDQGWANNAPTDANKGAVPKYTPKKTANIWTTYKVTDKVTAGVGLYYTGKRYVADSSSDQSKTRFAPGYVRTDAMLSYEERKYQVRLNVNNLTNKKYYDALYGGHASAASPREVQLTVGYKY
ncbi:TonB-dependent siderophore receptor [Vogesella sp. LYT5W]|uniref:TonB-dependent siderophore receptor n=1 Tax=Vogesella margarita TaxID=2984199 RepID=A0ABT5ITG3_9NEIS|nr:TonB-dependent siderophore receptor [Vogesella margarita]MDC7715565.1 TonB-dependent siderophore receptor [Vogesella margarita]